NRLMQAASEGAFTEFKGAAHISSLAARNIIIGMREGLVYSEACARAGYDHSARRTVSLDQIGRPATAISEAIKQVRTVTREYDPFDAVHIELARDVGKSAEERAEDIQQREGQGRSDDTFHVQQPWQDFCRDVTQVVYGENGIGGVFVSRAERRRARGKAHDATVKQIRQVNGEKIVFERRPIEKLTEKDLKRIPMPEPYGKMANPRELRDQMV